MIYAIDFDGVLVENEYPEIGPLNERAKQLVMSIKEHGDTFILWTCRSGEELDAAVKVLEDAGIQPDYVNENTPGMIKHFGNDCRKIFADVYIDDRNWLVIGNEWFRPGSSQENIRTMVSLVNVRRAE